jgi:8-oxo-dGTP pyrophosphatase MutT (NUDIX family)
MNDAPRAELLKILEAHTPADLQEEEHLARMLAWAKGLADPFARTTLPVHFTGSALVATTDGSGVWLVHHLKLYRWLQPGGHTEPQDLSPLDTAMREALEETGLEVSPHPGITGALDVDVHLIPARKTEPEHFHADVRFLLQARNEERVTAQEDEALAVRRFDWDDALSRVGESEAAFRRMSKKGRERTGR